MVLFALPHHFDEYDIIFTGGGTAACVTAGRLTTADPTLKVLILEAGPHSKDLPQVNVPAFFLQNLVSGSTTVTFHTANPSESLNSRAAIIPTARCVGGGSSINWLMYSRAAASDYDAWKHSFGNVGWGSEDLLPLLIKTETYQVASDKATHGYTGPLKVSRARVSNFASESLNVGARYDAGRGIAEDANDLETVDKWSPWSKWIDEKTGRRSDAASNFIYNQESNQNIVVAAGCRVNRIIFENSRAVGVEYIYDAQIHPNEKLTFRTATAKKLIVVSAGSLGSPAILERSGIGAADVLQRCDIEQVVDLPGVGAEYQDHVLIGHICVLDEKTETLDFVHGGEQGKIAEALEKWKEDGSGLLATNGIDVGIKMRLNAKELDVMGPHFQDHYHRNFEGEPDKAVVWCGSSAGLPNSHAGLPPIKIALFGQFLMYPESRGHVHIKSNDLNDPLDFECGFLKESVDLDALRWAYKRSREHARRHPLFRGEIGPGHPSFPAGSKAGLQDHVARYSESDISYTAEDDEAIDAFIRQTAGTTYHSLGTCPMKPREQGGVVDSVLNVYGVQGLKVADLSIAPHNVGGNTHSTALVIGEKAALIIAGELGIEEV